MLRYDCVIRNTPSLRIVCYVDWLRMLRTLSIVSKEYIVLRVLSTLGTISTRVLRVLDTVSTISI